MRFKQHGPKSLNNTCSNSGTLALFRPSMYHRVEHKNKLRFLELIPSCWKCPTLSLLNQQWMISARNYKDQEKKANTTDILFDSLLNILINFPGQPTVVISVELFWLAKNSQSDTNNHCCGHVEEVKNLTDGKNAFTARSGGSHRTRGRKPGRKTWYRIFLTLMLFGQH